MWGATEFFLCVCYDLSHLCRVLFECWGRVNRMGDCICCTVGYLFCCCVWAPPVCVTPFDWGIKSINIIRGRKGRARARAVASLLTFVAYLPQKSLEIKKEKKGGKKTVFYLCRKVGSVEEFPRKETNWWRPDKTYTRASCIVSCRFFFFPFFFTDVYTIYYLTMAHVPQTLLPATK